MITNDVATILGMIGLACKSYLCPEVSLVIANSPVFSTLRVWALCGCVNVLVSLVFLCSMFVPCANIVRETHLP